MAKQPFNAAELFLIQNWGEAQVLADTMAKARRKNDELLEKIGEAVWREYKDDLDVFVYIKDACLTFGGKWPREGNRPTGLYLDYLALGVLVSEERDDAPKAYVYVGPARRKADLDVASAKQSLWQKLPTLLTTQEQRRCSRYEDDRDILVGWPFSSKQEILGWITGGEEEKLAECVKEQVATFVKLVPVLNDLLRSEKAKNPSGSGVGRG